MNMNDDNDGGPLIVLFVICGLGFLGLLIRWLCWCRRSQRRDSTRGLIISAAPTEGSTTLLQPAIAGGYTPTGWYPSPLPNTLPQSQNINVRPGESGPLFVPDSVLPPYEQVPQQDLPPPYEVLFPDGQQKQQV